MILISFNGAVNVDNFKIYEEIFNDKTAINPNNCSAKGTFFVSHKYTNYSMVHVSIFLFWILRPFSVPMALKTWAKLSMMCSIRTIQGTQTRDMSNWSVFPGQFIHFLTRIGFSFWSTSMPQIASSGNTLGVFHLLTHLGYFLIFQ